MEGFQWTLKRKSSCLNFYFPSWKLDTIHKFIAAMLCVFIMAIITEGIARLKYDISHRAKKRSTRRRHRHRRLASVNNNDNDNYNKLWYIQTFLQGMNALFAYILMLVIMTYSLELLCCVIMGLMVGYFVFGGELYNHGAGSPCCNFLETEEEDDDDDNDNERDDEGTTTMITLAEALLPTLADNNDDDDDGNNNNNDDNYEEGTHRGYGGNSNDDVNEHSCCKDGSSSGGGRGTII